MKILITGATGFIGSTLCESLARDGHTLIVLARDPNRARSRIPAPHEVLKWDFCETSLPPNLELLKNLDAVIHLAGEPIFGKRWSSKLKAQLVDSRVGNMRRLISLFKTQKIPYPKVFISASAIGFYGDRGSETLEEGSAPGKGFLAQLCQEWEDCLLSSEMQDTRKIVLRFSIVLGKGGGALEQMLPIFSAGVGGRLGKGSQWMSWIHLEDLIAIIQECLRNKKLKGPINCCSPHPVTNREFTEALTKTLHTVGVLAVPGIALNLALGEGSRALLSSQKVSPLKLLEMGFSFRYPTIDSALQQILGDSYALGYCEHLAKCWLPLPIQEVFPFFSEARNLEKITPPWLNFHLVSQSSQEIGKGTLLDYQLKLHGIPIRWRSEISSWNPPHEFTDIQLKGPYQTWKHTHRFSELCGGTLMEDRVLYRLSFGVLGKIFAGNYVKGDVSKIFEFRNRTIYDLLL